MILSRLKKIKKNMEKSNFFFSSPGLHIGRMQAHFLKALEITYQFIFLSARSGNMNKKIKKIKGQLKKIKKNMA